MRSFPCCQVLYWQLILSNVSQTTPGWHKMGKITYYHNNNHFYGFKNLQSQIEQLPSVKLMSWSLISFQISRDIAVCYYVTVCYYCELTEVMIFFRSNYAAYKVANWCNTATWKCNNWHICAPNTWLKTWYYYILLVRCSTLNSNCANDWLWKYGLRENHLKFK